jgi:SEC-C motif-containing protein
MRSRFSAFAVSDRDYLLKTWHPATRPEQLDLDGGTRWTRLDIVTTVDGGPFDTTGVVEFRAHYRTADAREVLHERSDFVREGGRWLYLRPASAEIRTLRGGSR